MTQEEIKQKLINEEAEQLFTGLNIHDSIRATIDMGETIFHVCDTDDALTFKTVKLGLMEFYESSVDIRIKKILTFYITIRSTKYILQKMEEDKKMRLHHNIRSLFCGFPSIMKKIMKKSRPRAKYELCLVDCVEKIIDEPTDEVINELEKVITEKE